MLERAIAFAEETGASYINLFVDPTNSRAIALYHRVGFAEVDRQDQAIEMRINLTQPTEERDRIANHATYKKYQTNHMV